MTPCKKEHRPRQNNFGVSWCIDCGRLMDKPAPKKLTAIKINGQFVSLTKLNERKTK